MSTGGLSWRTGVALYVFGESESALRGMALSVRWAHLNSVGRLLGRARGG